MNCCCIVASSNIAAAPGLCPQHKVSIYTLSNIMFAGGPLFTGLPLAIVQYKLTKSTSLMNWKPNRKLTKCLSIISGQ